MSKPVEIGGVFGLPDCGEIGSRGRWPALQTPRVNCANGRCALYLLSLHLETKCVWLPAYLCDAIASAFHAAGVKLRFYAVSAALRIEDLAWLQEINDGDLVLLIDYFGFPCDQNVIAKAQEMGAVVVEDASQAMLLSPQTRADYLVYSPRKFLGVPDGGLLVSPNGARLPALPLTPPPTDWWLKSFAAVLQRRESDLSGAKRNWLQLFQQSEANAPCGPYAMSQLSAMLIDRAFDYDDIGRRRRENYSRLSERLARFAVFTRLPDRVVPLGFPIRVANRDAVRQALFEANIFPPVHWPLAELVPPHFEESHSLSREILTLVCDQRYDLPDMDRTAEIVLKSAAVSGTV
jgi:hypothetical protein